MKQYFDVKFGVCIGEEFPYMSPYLLKIFAAFSIYCFENNLPCLISSISGEASGRKSRTHSEFRAFDASVRDWDEFNIKRLVKRFNEEFIHLGAISASDLKPRAVIYHKVEGGAYHLHFQVKS